MTSKPNEDFRGKPIPGIERLLNYKPVRTPEWLDKPLMIAAARAAFGSDVKIDSRTLSYLSVMWLKNSASIRAWSKNEFAAGLTVSFPETPLMPRFSIQIFSNKAGQAMDDLIYLLRRQHALSGSQMKQIRDLVGRVHDLSWGDEPGPTPYCKKQVGEITKTLITDFWPELEHRPGALYALCGFVANSQDAKHFRVWFDMGFRKCWEIIKRTKAGKR